MSSIAFVVPGPPLTWKRTNIVRGRPITSAPQRRYQQHVKLCAVAGLNFRGLPWPVGARYRVDVQVYQPTRAPSDIDNFGKQVLDSLQGVLFANDKQVDDLRVRRNYDRMRPRIEVVIETLEVSQQETTREHASLQKTRVKQNRQEVPK